MMQDRQTDRDRPRPTASSSPPRIQRLANKPLARILRSPRVPGFNVSSDRQDTLGEIETFECDACRIDRPVPFNCIRTALELRSYSLQRSVVYLFYFEGKKCNLARLKRTDLISTRSCREPAKFGPNSCR